MIIDLEDAVPISEKEDTRSTVRGTLDGNPGKRLYVRVNGLRSVYCREDLECVVSHNLAGVLFPKVESANDVFRIDEFLTKAERTNGLKVGSIEVMTLCESAKGLEDINSIVLAKPRNHRVSLVAFGAADFTLDLGIPLTREGKELDYLLSVSLPNKQTH